MNIITQWIICHRDVASGFWFPSTGALKWCDLGTDLDGLIAEIGVGLKPARCAQTRTEIGALIAVQASAPASNKTRCREASSRC